MNSFTALKQEKLEDLISNVELTNEEIEMKLEEMLDNIQSYIREKNSIHRK